MIQGDYDERNIDYLHRDYSEYTLASGGWKRNCEKKDEPNYGLVSENGIELVIDFDFLFNYVDRDWLSGLRLLNIEEELLWVGLYITLITKKFCMTSPYIWLNIVAYAKVAWLTLLTCHYEKPAKEA